VKVTLFTRMGGDEFVAIFTDLSDVDDYMTVLDRLLRLVSKQTFIEGHGINISASIGVTFYPQEVVMEPGQLMRQADQAMYQAKVDGKNCYRVFDAKNDRFLKTQHEHLEQARAALKNGEFVLFYQPKVNMTTAEVVGAEGLIRWLHPEKGILYPNDFRWAFKDHSFIVDLGEWVIAAALVQLDNWHSSGFSIPVSVNISPVHLSQAKFVPHLVELLSKYPDLAPQSLELEVLETSETKSIKRMYKNMAACRDIGVRFSLDDFGTGYSSLLHLKNLPVASLKIDKSFVLNILDSADDLTIVKAILGLAKAFGLSVVAEGVETSAHGQKLQQLGCELAQGYAIAKAMPAQDWPGWLLDWRRNPLWVQTVPGGETQASNEHASSHYVSSN